MRDRRPAALYSYRTGIPWRSVTSPSRPPAIIPERRTFPVRKHQPVQSPALAFKPGYPSRGIRDAPECTIRSIFQGHGVSVKIAHRMKREDAFSRDSLIAVRQWDSFRDVQPVCPVIKEPVPALREIHGFDRISSRFRAVIAPETKSLPRSLVQQDEVVVFLERRFIRKTPAGTELSPFLRNGSCRSG